MSIIALVSASQEAIFLTTVRTDYSTIRIRRIPCQFVKEEAVILFAFYSLIRS